MVAKLRIQVVYALAEAQDLAALELTPGATARDAIEASSMTRRHPEIDSQRMRLAIFGRQVRLDQTLCDGDRIEILRPLAADPKEARRRRARRGDRR